MEFVKKDHEELYREKKHIAIAGNIGAGKSSLTNLISEYFDWKAYYERVDDNPYLSDFYKDMRRWSFNLQVFFLSSRFNQQLNIEANPDSVVQDRSIYEDVEIFARNLFEMDLMSPRDYKNYSELFGVMTAYLRPPDLLIYLKASVPTLEQHIESRGRDFETTIRPDYLNRLNVLYDEWIDRYKFGPTMVIEVDTCDYVNSQNDRQKVLSDIESRLFGMLTK